MTGETRAGFTPNLVVGVGLTLLGVVLTLDKLGVVDAIGWLRFWPVLLVLFGVSIVVQALRPVAGVRPQPILSAPLVILLVVVGFVGTRASGWPVTATTADGDSVSVHAVMSGNRHAVAGRPFRHGEMTAVMGESRLDLRNAVLAPGEEAVIDVVTIMGSTIVFVPRDWDVNFDAVPVMGGINDERGKRAAAGNDGGGDVQPSGSQPSAGAPSSDGEATGSFSGPRPRLVLRGFVLMGGLVVRS
jgi:hypothetical protein